jgi:hypothetical protein
VFRPVYKLKVTNYVLYLKVLAEYLSRKEGHSEKEWTRRRYMSFRTKAGSRSRTKTLKVRSCDQHKKENNIEDKQEGRETDIKEINVIRR